MRNAIKNKDRFVVFKILIVSLKFTDFKIHTKITKSKISLI